MKEGCMNDSIVIDGTKWMYKKLLKSGVNLVAACLMPQAAFLFSPKGCVMGREIVYLKHGCICGGSFSLAAHTMAQKKQSAYVTTFRWFSETGVIGLRAKPERGTFKLISYNPEEESKMSASVFL